MKPKDYVFKEVLPELALKERNSLVQQRWQARRAPGSEHSICKGPVERSGERPFLWEPKGEG